MKRTRHELIEHIRSQIRLAERERDQWYAAATLYGHGQFHTPPAACREMAGRQQVKVAENRIWLAEELAR